MTHLLSDHTRNCRKAVQCDQCGKHIEIGQRYRRQVYRDGALCTYRAHEDCDNAASEAMANGGWDPRYDDPIVLTESICPDNSQWLLERYPAVAARLGITQEPTP